MKKYIIGNWKCNPITLKEAQHILMSVKEGIKELNNAEVVICSPFIYLPELRNLNSESNIKLGAQNCFWEEKGAFTGEVSPQMLKDIGCEYVILGHSERRKYFQESDEIINKKIKKALEVGLKVIFCIGESEEERKAGKTKELLEKQLKKGLEGILNSVIVAYEPIWAIGTGKACEIPEAKEVNLFIKEKIPGKPILYGGSVNSQNGKNYVKEAGFDGLLVGGASLKAEEFINIIKSLKD